MPYRVENNCLQVNHGGHWETVPGGCHKTRAEAEAHMRAVEAHTHGKNLEKGETRMADEQSQDEKAERPSMDIQTVIVSKDVAKTLADAKKKIPDGFSTGSVDETEDSFRFRQRAPGDFQDESFRTFTPEGFPKGVTAVGGRLKAGKKEVDNGQKMVMRLSQQEVAFEPVSTHSGQACAGCRWYALREMMCHIVDNYPSEIASNSYCNRYEAQPGMEPMQPEPVPVVIVEPEAHEMGQGEMSLSEPEQKSKLERFSTWIKDNLLQLGDSKELACGFKAHPTNNTWFAWWTTTTKDLDGEFFPTKAVDEFIQRVKGGAQPYPELWPFHLGLKAGQAKWLDRVGLLVAAAGTFDDTPRAKAFQTWARQQKGELPVSHGFKYLKALKRNGIYWHFNTFEISFLHPVYQKAANPIAKFNEVYTMAIKPEQIKALAEVFGSDELAQAAAKEALEVMEKKSKALEAQGIEFKETGEAPEIPVIDADARKEVEALKAAQASSEKTIQEAVAAAVEETGETIAKALKAELDQRDATIIELTQKLTTLTDRVDKALTLGAPATQSVLTQILSGSKAYEEAVELQKHNTVPAQKSVLEQVLNGVTIPGAQ